LERKLAAILAADVVGYSALMEADEAGTLAALLSLRRELIDPRIADHNGRLVKLMGDGALVEFASVVDAVECAVGIQQAMAARSSDIAEDRRIRFRIGVHLGDVIVEGGDIYGDGVNIAARLEVLAEPGDVCLSQQAYDQVETKLDLSYEDLGEQRVKNISRPIRVWRWASDSEPRQAKQSDPLTLPDKPSIAVLPFDNMSHDPDQEYFADGIAEDLITGLSRMRWFFVTARNSSFTYKGRRVDVTQISRELGVRYVLEGSVRKSGNRVRITVQLIDAASGNHLWAERYDRELKDIFAVQDEITETVVATIEPQLYAAESARAGRKPPETLDAWDLAMRAMPHLWRMTGADNERAQTLLEAAIERDPNYAPAYGPLGFSYIWHAWMGWGQDPTRLIPKAEESGRRAIALDDLDPWAHLVMACVYGYRRRHEDAVDEIRRALDLNPNFSIGHAWLGIVMAYAGKFQESNEAVDRAYRISPRDPFNAWLPALRSIVYFAVERNEEARELAYETIKLRPDMVGAWRVVTITSAHLGDLVEARRALAQTKRLQPSISLAWARDFGPWVRPADLDRYVEGFRLAGLE
jgi:adenylate cyclase